MFLGCGLDLVGNDLEMQGDSNFCSTRPCLSVTELTVFYRLTNQARSQNFYFNSIDLLTCNGVLTLSVPKV